MDLDKGLVRHWARLCESWEDGGSAALGESMGKVLDAETVRRMSGEESFTFDVDYGVKEIGEGAFRDMRDLRSVNVPETVERIGDAAFQDCRNLVRVSVPGSVKEIGELAFDNCLRLEEVELDGVERLGDYAFSESGVKSVVLGPGLRELGEEPFYRCGNLEEVLFLGKTEDEVKALEGYPWGIGRPEKVVKCRP